MRYALAIALMLTLSFGLITESFRYQSTAQIWEDDYDLLFDPARIPQIEGSRVWTGLANLVTGTEEGFSNASQPYLLIGGVTNYNTFFPAGVYDRSVSKTPLNTGLVDPLGHEIYGEGSVETINWQLDPTNGDPIYREVTNESVIAFDRHAYANYYVALGMQMNNMRFGLGYMHRDHTQTFTDPNNNYDYEYFEEDIEDDSLEYRETAVYSGDEINSSSENDFILSGWMDKEQMAIGADFRYDMLSNNEEAFITGAEEVYTGPDDPDAPYMLTDNLDSLTLPEAGSRMALNVKVFYDWNDNAQGRVYGGYFMKSTSYDAGAIENMLETVDYHGYDDGDPDMYTTTDFTSSSYTGDFKYNGFRLGTKQLFEVSENFRFGFGFFVTMTSVNDSVNRFDSTYTYIDSTDGDTLVNNSYEQYSVSTERWAMVTDGSVNTFNIPVGMEFNLAKSVVLRLGVNHTITTNDLTTNYVLEAWDPEYTYYENNDTSYSWEFYQSPSERPENTSENDVQKISSTSYSYGIGWKVTDNLQLDFMNFSDLTDLGDWRLSATLHFD
jgi:hypothetical protein